VLSNETERRDFWSNVRDVGRMQALLQRIAGSVTRLNEVLKEINAQIEVQIRFTKCRIIGTVLRPSVCV
jgi:hypothetical protein